MLLCAAAALGTQSRGALLAIIAMAVMFWWRGGHKVADRRASSSLAACACWSRSCRQTWDDAHEHDPGVRAGRVARWGGSMRGGWRGTLRATGRSAAASTSTSRISSPRMRRCPTTSMPRTASTSRSWASTASSGLALFLLLWMLRLAHGRLAATRGTQARRRVGCRLGAMCQASLAGGYAVGGAFLSLAYFDLPYNFLVLVVAGAAMGRGPRLGARTGAVSAPLLAQSRRRLERPSADVDERRNR